MASGLTAKIYSGEDTSFRDYALRCASRFGAFYSVTEDGEKELPRDKAPIIEVDSYYYDCLSAAEKRLKRWQFLKDNPDEARKIYDKQVDEYNETQRKRLKDKYVNPEARTRYEEMLKKVKSWKVKKDYTPIKNLMIQKLEESIAFDCKKVETKINHFMDFEDWLKMRYESAIKDVDFYKEKILINEQNARDKNKYIKGFYAALDAVEPIEK